MDSQQENGNLKRLVGLRPRSLQLTSVFRFDFKLASEPKNPASAFPDLENCPAHAELHRIQQILRMHLVE
jgi:hypothetical protein